MERILDINFTNLIHKHNFKIVDGQMSTKYHNVVSDSEAGLQEMGDHIVAFS